jgi:Protein of unknown function (DUF4012)
VLAGLASIPALGAARHLEDGRVTLARARSLLLGGDVDAAVDAFARARSDFAHADADANGPLVDLLALVPVAGRTPDALRHLTNAAEEVAEAGWLATREIAALPGGLSSMSLSQGALPLDVLRELSPTIQRVRAMIEHAKGEADLAATTLVPRLVTEAGDRAREDLERLTTIVRGVDEVLSVFPSFAGADGTRRYFLAAQTPAELRGTGGFIGSYSILTMDEGTIRLSPFRTIHSLPSPRDRDPEAWPSPEVEAAFGSFDSAEVWTNANVPPDAPTASALILKLWERIGRPPLDGVIFVDVQALAYLLRPLGSVDVQGVDVTLTPDNVVRFVTSEVYRLYPLSSARKDFLGIVGQEIFGRFLIQSSGEDVVRALVSAVADGHILLTASDPEIQSAFVAAGVAGALGGTTGQTFAVVINNIGANKLDAYLHQDVSWDVSLLPGGEASIRAVVELRNTAPRDAEPSVVFGPSGDPRIAPLDLVPGETYLQAFIYCGPGCELVSGSSGGEALALQSFPWQELAMYSTSLRIEPGGSRTLELGFEVDGAWDGDDAMGTYRVDIHGQPLLHPATATISVTPPEGMSVDWASEGASIERGMASWSGELGAGRTVGLRFQRGFLGRLWAAIGS